MFNYKIIYNYVYSYIALVVGVQNNVRPIIVEGEGITLQRRGKGTWRRKGKRKTRRRGRGRSRRNISGCPLAYSVARRAAPRRG